MFGGEREKRPVMTFGLLTTRAAIDPVGSRGRLRDGPGLRVVRAVAAEVLAPVSSMHCWRR